MSVKTPSTTPLSMKPSAAAKLLNLHAETVRAMIRRGVFTALYQNGRGPGKRVFIPTDEVELFGLTRSEDAVAELRARKARRTPGARGV